MIRPVPPSVAEIRALLASCPEASVYCTPEFLAFLQHAVDGELVILSSRAQGRLTGILPFFCKSVPGCGAVINSLPWFGSHGGCLAAEGDTAARRELITAYAAYLRNIPDLVSATISLSPFEERYADLYQEILPGHIREKRNGQILPLDPIRDNAGAGLEKAALAVMTVKSRNLARKALKQNFTHAVEDSDEAWDFLYATHRENMEAIGGVPKLRRHLDAVRGHLRGLYRLHTAFLGDNRAAAMLCLYCGSHVEYIMPVIKLEYRSSQPLSFLIHNDILTALRENRRYWNFGGTWASQTNLHRFKAGWGAQDFPYSYLIGTGPGGLERIRKEGARLFHAFPFYFIYPFYLL